MKRVIGMLLAIISAPTFAQDVSDANRFTCLQGDCRNGQGTVRDVLLGIDMRGRWVNASTVAGESYTLTLPAAPGKQFVQRYAADGLLESGDNPRSLGVIDGVVPRFSGTYKRVQHPFVRSVLAVIDQGVYDTGTGIQYRGRFQYLPSRGVQAGHWASGYFIFSGDKVDMEENETEHGLFISDEASAGVKVRFVKAAPSYLAVLENKRRRDLQIANDEFNEQESRKRWLYALSILSDVATAVTASGNPLGGGSGGQQVGGNLLGVTGYKSNVGNDIAIELVSAMLTGNTEQLDVTGLALKAVSGSVKDKPLANQLIKVVNAVQNAP